MSAFVRYLARFRGAAPRIAFAAGLLGVTGALPGAAVWLLRDATDRLAAGLSATPQLGALLAVSVAHGGLTLARGVLTRRIGWSLVHDLRMDAHRAWHHVPADALPSVGDRLSALTHEADELQYGVSALVTAVRNPVSVGVLAASAAWMAPGLAWRFALLIPLLALPAVIGAWLVRRGTRRWRQDRSALLSELADQHGGLPTTQDLRAEGAQIARAHVLSAREADARARLDWLRGVPSALVQVGLVAALVGLLVWGAGEVSAGQATVGGVVGFAVALGLLQRPLAGLVEVGAMLQRSLTALERVDALLERVPELDEPSPPPAGLAFALADVRVPGRLSGVELQVPVGAKVALVGESGAGKSSLLAVLAGQLRASGVRRVPAVLVRQDPWVFDRSVAENLRLGAPGADDATLSAALGKVGLHAALDRGLDEGAGERGGRYSGGERQRLCLARALLTGTDALLLDEASSELDPASARALAEHLMTLPATVIFAAHDGQFAGLADRVIHLHRGRIMQIEVRR